MLAALEPALELVASLELASLELAASLEHLVTAGQIVEHWRVSGSVASLAADASPAGAKTELQEEDAWLGLLSL